MGSKLGSYLSIFLIRGPAMTLGSLIAKARKDAALSVDDVAAATNLRAAIINEIEKDNFSQCGGQTYARGHVRIIAKTLSADEREFLRIFDEEQGVEKRTMRDLLTENSVMQAPDGSRRISFKTLLIISVASLGIAGIAQIVITNSSSIDLAEPTVSASPTRSGSATPSNSGEPSPESSISTGTGVSVIITAIRAKSWLFVSDSAGRTLFSGQVLKGSTKTFTTDTRLDLKVGNAGGIDIEVNGKKRDAIGVDGEVVSLSYGADS